MTLLLETVAWFVVGLTVGGLIVLAFVLTAWALLVMWERGDRLWAMATIGIPLVVTWALWVIKS